MEIPNNRDSSNSDERSVWGRLRLRLRCEGWEKACDHIEKAGKKETSDFKVELPSDWDSSSDDEDSDRGKLRVYGDKGWIEE